MPADATRFCGAEDAACTVTVTVVEWFKEPLVPVTVTMYVPAVVLEETAMDSVDEADPPDVTASEVELSVAVKPAGADAATETVPLNPLSDATVIVELPEVPCWILSELGDADKEKSETARLIVVECDSEGLMLVPVTVIE